MKKITQTPKDKFSKMIPNSHIKVFLVNEMAESEARLNIGQYDYESPQYNTSNN